MNTLVELIDTEIEAAGGAISFARFMDLALYAPAVGYYERSLAQVGRGGDFYTSVSVGPLFGHLLAFQFAAWLRPLQQAGPTLQIVEAGAHTGHLAADILEGLKIHAPDLLPVVEYRIIEPSASRRAVQQRTLSAWQNVRWCKAIPAPATVRGVIFSNELLDAMPVHPFVWYRSGHCWRERAVMRTASAFAWTVLPKPSVQPPIFPEELLQVLPDGYTVELCPSARDWWHQSARSLETGTLMTIDYGGTIEELLSPGRTAGTLRAYSKHAVSGDVLASPGDQDITAHVNFSEIRQAGKSAGLATAAFTTQAQFLTAVAQQMWTTSGSWPASQVRQFQTLTHPQHLGTPFRVLVQGRR